MSDRGKKLLFWGSLLILFLALSGMIFTIANPSKQNDKLLVFAVILLVISGLNIWGFFSIKYQERKWLRRSAKFSTFLLPVSIIGAWLVSVSSFDYELIELFLVIIISLLILFSIIYIFIIREPDEIIWMPILISIIIICVVFPKFSASYDFFEEFFLPITVIVTIAGIYMFGFRCLFILGKNIYLKIVSYIACLMIVIGGFAFLFKMLGEGMYVIEVIYFIPAFLLTLTVVLSLPLSGYVNWSKIHKGILKKIMISWIFFFMIFSIRFVFPESFKIIITDKKKNVYNEFLLNDYKLENKNGLVPE